MLVTTLPATSSPTIQEYSLLFAFILVIQPYITFNSLYLRRLLCWNAFIKPHWTIHIYPIIRYRFP